MPLLGGSMWPLRVAIGYNCQIAGLLCTWEYSNTFSAPLPIAYGVNYNPTTQSAVKAYPVFEKSCPDVASTCDDGSVFCTMCQGMTPVKRNLKIFDSSFQPGMKSI